MADPASGWSWFDAAGFAGTDDTAAAVARCLATPDGARLLAVLRALSLDRALGPDATDAALRHLEGQRALVITLLALAARGRGERP